VSEAEQNELLNKIKSRYEKQTSPYYAAARLWVDDIIDPIQTRLYISEGIAAANQNADIKDLKLGVFQV
jgi:acetyl-CoA carboxylase carboxyltransferase component